LIEAPMVSEKVAAAFEAAASLLSGAKPAAIGPALPPEDVKRLSAS
jgi:hypothetical protein